MDQYLSTGRFPATPMTPAKTQRAAFVETEVRTRNVFEWLQIFVIVGIFGLVYKVVARMWDKLANLV
jgi:lysocardiolipin and lysophospholipid acyltransferase